MLLLILDTETTGIEPDASMIEVGAILYRADLKTQVASISVVLPVWQNPAEPINRIPVAATTHDLMYLVDIVDEWAQKADYATAYNLAFDLPFLTRHGIDSKNWFCSMADIRWPRATRRNGSLVYTALEHDVAVVKAHRALDDCDILARMLATLPNLPGVIKDAAEHWKSPPVTIVAKAKYENRDAAKALGFRWDAGAKQWQFQCKECDLHQLLKYDFADAPFECEVIG